MKLIYIYIFALFLYSCQKEEINFSEPIKKIDNKFSKQDTTILSKKTKRKIFKRKRKKMKASDIKLNEISVVVELSEGFHKQKLTEMGCVPGTKIKKVISNKYGPSGYEISGDYILALRKEEANSIIVNSL